MRVMSVVGARPQFVKLAPVDHALHEAEVEHAIVHTGQHIQELGIFLNRLRERSNLV